MLSKGPGNNKTENRQQKRKEARNTKKSKVTKKEEKKQNPIKIQAEEIESTPEALNSKIGFGNESTNLVNYLLTLARDPDVNVRFEATNYAIKTYKKQLINNFDSFMVSANQILKNPINYDNLVLINDQIHKEHSQNPNSVINKEIWKNSEEVIEEAFVRLNFWHLLLHKFLPELGKKRKVQDLENLLIKNILRDLPATYCLIERFVRNELLSDYYLSYKMLREKCNWILKIGAKAQNNLLFDLNQKIKSGKDTEEILSDSRSLLLCYEFSMVYSSYFLEDSSDLLSQAMDFSKQLVEKGPKINELKSKEVLEDINLFKQTFEKLVEEKKAHGTNESLRVNLFNTINGFYANEWYSNSVPQEIPLKRFIENVDALILCISEIMKNTDDINSNKTNIDTKILNVLSEYNVMSIGDKRYQAGNKVLQLLDKLIPYITFAPPEIEKCVVLTTAAILKWMEKDIQEEMTILGQNKENNIEQNNQNFKQPQPIQTVEEALLEDISTMTLNEMSKSPTKELEKTQVEFKEREKEIYLGFLQIAQTSSKLFEREIKVYENKYFEKEQQIIEKYGEELKTLQSKMVIFLEDFKKKKEAEFKVKKLLIMQNHEQQMNACKDNFEKEKKKLETECKTWDKNVRDQNNKELESLENEHKRCQINIINQIEIHKKQIEKEVQKYKDEIAKAKEDVIEKNKDEIRQEEKKFLEALNSLKQLLMNQNEQEITLIKERQKQEIQKLKLELHKEHSFNLEKIKTNIKQDHDKNCEKLLNMHQERILALKQEIISKIAKENEDIDKINKEKQLLMTQNEQEITLIKERQKQEIQKLELEFQKEYPSNLEKIKINIKQDHDKNCEKLLNTHQERILALKLEYANKIAKDKEDLDKINNEEIEQNKQKFKKTKNDLIELLKNQNQQKISLTKVEHEKELQKLQEEQAFILEKIKMNIQQNYSHEYGQLLNTQQKKISELKHSIEQTRKPYKSIIGLTPRATISYFPGEVKVILNLLEKHNIENYIFGGYVRDALCAEMLLDSDDIDIRVNCDPKDLPSDILACVGPFVQIDMLKVGRVERVNLVCGPLENLKAELLSKDFKINTLICRNGRVYDLLGVYDQLKLPYLETVKSLSECIIEKPSIILRLIRLSIKLNRTILSNYYATILENAHLIFNLSCGIYLSNLKKMFTNYAAPEYYKRVKNLGLLHIVIPILFKNYEDYDGFFILEQFWLQKMQEFSHSPRHYNGYNVLALFLLMPLLLKLNELTISYVERDPITIMNQERRKQYVESNFQFLVNELIKVFVGFSVTDQNLIHRRLLPFIMGSDNISGLYQEYHHFKALELKNQSLVSQEVYGDVLMPFGGYTPAYQFASQSTFQSHYFLEQRNDIVSTSVSENRTAQSFMLKRKPYQHLG